MTEQTPRHKAGRALRNPWTWANALAAGAAILIGDTFKDPKSWWPGFLAQLIAIVILCSLVQAARAVLYRRRGGED